MSITYPLTNFAAVAGGLRVGNPPFMLMRRQEFSRTAGGVVLAKDLGPALWRADVVTVPRRRRDAFALGAWLDSLQGGLGTFLLSDRTRRFPASDPTGAHPDTVEIAASVDGEVALKGLPAGFVLTPGDMIGWTYGTGGAGYALHQVLEARTANGSGVTTSFAVEPPVRDGTATVDAPVAMKDATAEFRLESATPEIVGEVLLSYSISAVQVVR